MKLRRYWLIPLLFNLLFGGFSSADSPPTNTALLDNVEFAKKCAEPDQLAANDLSDIQQWLKKPLGALQRCKLTPENIRILIYSGGFAIFLPRVIWREFDVQVSRYLNQGEPGASWIADETYAWLNIVIIDWNIKIPTLLDYISRRPEVVLSKVSQFVENNFFKNPQAHPESSEYSMGSYIDEPDQPRFWRHRTGGNFRLRF